MIWVGALPSTETSRYLTPSSCCRNGSENLNTQDEGWLADADWNRVLEVTPRYAPDYCWRGRAFQEKREYDRALACYTSAACLRVYPSSLPSSRKPRGTT